jgi:hypothetical protein
VARFRTIPTIATAVILLAGLGGAPHASPPAAAGFVAALTPAPPGEATSLPERSERVVTYRIEATLDPPGRTVRGSETLTWRNVTGETVSDLRFHLYLNAFKNEKSTFMRESKGRHRGFRARDGGWGYIDLASLRIVGGADLLKAASFIHPDDDNADDETVLQAPLPQPVPPGGSVTLEAVFASRLPRVFARTGYKGSFYLVGQWFPKLGVYEPRGARGRATGGWNCHQYHSTSEFYADFGTFDVKLTVPSTFVVGATGAETEPPRRDGDATTYHFAQEDVHDFAWTADPEFLKVTRTFSYAAERDADEERRMARILGLDPSVVPPAGSPAISSVPASLRLSDVEVTLLIQPEHRALIDRHFRAAFNAIKYYGYWYGRYPYRTLTIVDPAYGARGAGGMEYPTFITAGSTYLAPAKRLSPEGVTVHEFGHQFWYGMIANNEFEEAWLDEGFNTYATGKVLEKAYGPNYEQIEIEGVPLLRFPLVEIPADPSPAAAPGDRPDDDRLSRFLYLRWTGASNDELLNAFRDLPFVNFPSDVAIQDPLERRRRFLKSGPTKDDLLRDSWKFLDDESYANNSYSKTAMTLRTLEGLLGSDTVARALRIYAERFRFKHPCTDDFIATVNEISGRDMSWFFDETVRGSGLLDYAVASASSGPVKGGAGVFGPPGSRRTVGVREARAASPEAHELENEVIVRRLGGVAIPVRLQLSFASGKTEVRDWDGRYRWLKIRERSTDALVAARVDPADEIALDANWPNNARSVDADRWPAIMWWTRIVTWAEAVLFFYSGMA